MADQLDPVARPTPAARPRHWTWELFQAMDDAMLATGPDGTVVDFNPVARSIYGFDAVMVRREPIDRLLGAPAGEMAALVEDVLATKTARRVETTHRRSDGTLFPAAVTASPIVEDSEAVGAVIVVRDVSALVSARDRERQFDQDHEAQQRILQRIVRGDDLHRTLDDLCRSIEARFPGSRCTVLLVDPSRTALRHAAAPTMPPAFSRAIDGLPIEPGSGACGAAAATGETVVIEDILTHPYTQPFTELARAHSLTSVWSHPLVDREGTILGTFAVYRRSRHRPDEEEQRSVAAAGRLAALAIERRRDNDALAHAATVDPLTGLPNRNRFLDLLDKAIADDPNSVAVLFMDLDRFKAVNDSVGHPAGDRLLFEASRRLAAILRTGDILSRFGGDEFTLLVRDTSSAAITAVADRVIGAFAEPFVLEDREFYVSVSIGVAIGCPGVGPFDLIRDADVAMYEAKSRGSGRYVVFGEELRHAALERVTLEADLRRALERDELVVEYQPIFDLATCGCVGAEALVRWNHPERGMLPPGDFIPLAEETGLIDRVGTIVLEKVLAQIRRWQADGIDLTVAVNVSAMQLDDPMFADGVRDALDRYGVAHDRLVLEITESTLMEHVDAQGAVLRRLDDAGIDIVIDDFGTGYSSIGRLQDLPVVGLKVDRRFVAALGTDSQLAKVTLAVIDLAHALDMRVVAEGIETQATLDALVDLECQYGQGFHLARPGPPEAVTALL